MSGPKQKRIFSVPRKACKMCVRQNIRPPAGCGGKTRTVLRNELTGLPDCRGKPVIHQKHSEDEAASSRATSLDAPSIPTGTSGAATTVPARLAQLIAATADVNHWQREARITFSGRGHEKI